MSSQSQELEALEARLRETEERLKQRQSRASSPAAAGSGRKSTHRRPGIGRTFGGEGSEQEQAPATSPLAAQPLSSQSRPSTGKAPSYTVPPMPGAMPETPGDIGKSDYGMVDRGGGTQQYEGFNPNGFDQGHQGDFAPQPTRRPPPKPSD